MKEKEILRKTEEFVKECMIDNEPGHDYLHIVRVKKMALHLASTVDCDKFVVTMVALLHDLEDHKFENKYNAKEFLDTLDILDFYKERILFLLPYISFSKYRELPEVFPIEAKIVQDADRLDALGAIGVARTFSYGGRKNRRMYGTIDSTLRHFDEKLLILDNYLYLEESKKIAKVRMKFIKEFYDEFRKEVDY